MYFDSFLFQNRGVRETQTKAYAIKGKYCSIYTCVSIFIVNVKFHEILHINFEQRRKNIKLLHIILMILFKYDSIKNIS